MLWESLFGAKNGCCEDRNALAIRLKQFDYSFSVSKWLIREISLLSSSTILAITI